MKLPLLFAALALASGALAQNIGINSTGNTGHASAGLDVDFNNKGLLVPRVALTTATSATPISSPAVSLLVYNTATAGTGANAVAPGYYFWTGSRWSRLFDGRGSGWSTLGDAGTDPASNFLGTTDEEDLVLRTNNAERMRLWSDGKVSVNVPAPFEFTTFSVNGLSGNDAIAGFGLGTNAFGVYGQAQGTGGVGVGGLSTSSTGFGLYAVNTHASGTGLLAIGNNVGGSFLTGGGGVAATGELVGVVAFTEDVSINSIGLWGYNSGTSVLGTSEVNNGTGVWGEAMNGPNAWGSAGMVGNGNNARGVYGSAGSGNNAVGVYGTAAAGGDNRYGGFFANDLGSSGTKTFMIDLPSDPENYSLKHFSMESPEVINTYRGNVVLNGNGSAVVELPEYFYEVNNENISYHLTPIGAPSQVYILNEVSDGQFEIAGGNPGQKVSWMIMAERNDPYLQQYPEERTVVVPKRENAGKYITPELYGQPQEKGMFYKPRPTRPEAKPVEIGKRSVRD